MASQQVSRRQLLAASLGGLATPLVAQARKRPNIMIILADDQGWGDLSINGNTMLCAVVTDGAGYSLSPQAHNRGSQELGLDFLYLRHSVGAEDLASVINGIKRIPSYRGLSIGTPHKLEVRKYLDDVDQVAVTVGAVNTVVIERDARGGATMMGTNTDWYGIAQSLRARGVDLANKRVAIIGAAGAARAAVYAVREAGRVKVFNRADDYLNALQADLPGIDVGTLDDLQEISDFDIVIHATRVGMSPGDESLIPQAFLKPTHVVFDLVYSAGVRETDLVAKARSKGAVVLQGTEMFFWQATEQFRLFTGREPPVEAMRSILS